MLAQNELVESDVTIGDDVHSEICDINQQIVAIVNIVVVEKSIAYIRKSVLGLGSESSERDCNRSDDDHSGKNRSDVVASTQMDDLKKVHLERENAYPMRLAELMSHRKPSFLFH